MWGGGIYNYFSAPTFINNTIFDNSADSSGGGLYCFRGDHHPIVLFNNIIRDNPTVWGKEIFVKYYEDSYCPCPCTLFIDFNNIDTTEVMSDTSANIIYFGHGNINVDPFFSDTLFHLSDSSRCLDAGCPFVVPPWSEDSFSAPTTDYEGDTRPYNRTWDIGADEYTTGMLVFANEKKPEKLDIHAYPNPFNSNITIFIKNTSSKIKVFNNVSLKVYNFLGNEVFDLTPEILSNINKNEMDINWNGQNSTGKQQNSGIYFAKLSIGKYEKTVKLLLIK